MLDERHSLANSDVQSVKTEDSEDFEAIKKVSLYLSIVDLLLVLFMNIKCKTYTVGDYLYFLIFQ